MNNYPSILKALAWRALIALPFFVMGITGGLGLFSPFLIVIGGIIIGAPLARLIAEPSGSLFYPGTRTGKVEPVYSVPESLRKKGDYEEAMAGFEAITISHPDEVKPYIEMIDIAVMDLRDANRADDIYRRGMATLGKEEDRKVLTGMHRAIRSRLEKPAEPERKLTLPGKPD